MSSFCILVCKECNEEFVVLAQDQAYLAQGRRKPVKYCKSCFLEKKRNQRNLERAQRYGYSIETNHS